MSLVGKKLIWLIRLKQTRRPVSLWSRLTRFTPPIVFREMRASDTSFLFKNAYQDNRWAAVLFLDISGFTALTERLASEGPDGTEELTIILNQHFTELVDLVNVWGGEVVAYAGDAFAAIFPGPPGEIRLSAQIRRNIVELAAHCAGDARRAGKDGTSHWGSSRI